MGDRLQARPPVRGPKPPIVATTTAIAKAMKANIPSPTLRTVAEKTAERSDPTLDHYDQPAAEAPRMR
jgi:hypothetical protein